MHEPPQHLTEAELCSALHEQYALNVTSLAFLPIGHDSAAWVYRVQANDQTYLLKVRAQVTNPASLHVPRYLRGHGVTQVIAPLLTRNHALWANVADFAMIVYPFIAGETGMQQGMTKQQWRTFGATMRQIHNIAVADTLAQQLRRETFAPTGADKIRQLDAYIGKRHFADEIANNVATYWRAHRAEIQLLLERAEALGRRLTQTQLPLHICHADAHTNNILLDNEQRIWIVDWDETMLAPKERDLMFVVGGISTRLVSATDTTNFIVGYGETAIDMLALAYYRYAWAISDLSDFSDQVFLRTDLGALSKQQAAHYCQLLFDPGAIVTIALGSQIPSDL